MGGAVANEGAPAKGGRRAVMDVIAGGIAGAVSRVVVGPLDVIKIRMQVQLEPVRAGAPAKYTGVKQALTTIVREEGLRGLWRGTIPAVLLTVPYCAVQFSVLQRCKQSVAAMGITDPKLTAAASFISGAAAGAAATLASYPFDLLRTILASQGSPPVYRGMSDAAVKLVQQRGLLGLYSGASITLLEIIPYAGVQFGTYDLMLRRANQLLPDHGLSSSVHFCKYFIVGLAAGIAGKSITHPLDVVKKRYQVSGLKRPLSYGARVDLKDTSGLRRCVMQIYSREGVSGFFKGLRPSLLKAAPASAVTFVAYEFIVGYLVGSLR